MATLELHGELQHLIRMKQHLEHEHPSTRGNMVIRGKIPLPVQSKKVRFMNNLKGTFKEMGSSTGRILEKLEQTDRNIEEKMRKVTGSVA